jgi:hypothetical protein
MDAMNGSDTANAEARATADQAAPESGKARAKAKVKKQPEKRQITQSTIGFPYRDLESAISVAKAILDAGGVGLTADQLAGVMGLQPGNGNFVVRLATARIFGLVANQGGKYELSTLGFEILDKDDKRQRQARANAFLTVPLYKKTFEEFRGKQLPPRPHGLEQAFVRFGVSLKQKMPARQIFEKSATQAGFFNADPDRLVEPIIGGGAAPPPPPTPEDRNGNGSQRQPNDSGGEDAGPDVSGFHPFIQGLLDTLPEPETTWTVEGRAKWLMAASNIFDLIYKGSGEIVILVKPEEEK